MKNLLLAIVVLSCMDVNAQPQPLRFDGFIGSQKIVSQSGPGLENEAGDILLELKEPDNDDVVNLMVLRRNKEKLTKVAENCQLLMGPDMLGIAGGNYPSLNDKTLSVDYSLGSNSASSDITIRFEKNNNGEYDFKEYTCVTSNFGVENLFARQKVTSEQTGKIVFANAHVDNIARFSKSKFRDPYPLLQKASIQYGKYIPEGYQLVALGEGDLNRDPLAQDAVLILNNGEQCSIRLLTRQANGSFAVARTNNSLIAVDSTYNSNNLAVAVKEGYFTIEQRVATDNVNFDHRYITFRYESATKRWLLHRYDVEHFSGFNPQPIKPATHLSRTQLGDIPFEKSVSY